MIKEKTNKNIIAEAKFDRINCTKLIDSLEEMNMVTVIIRGNVFEIRSGMTLLSSLLKLDILPETVLATRNGEMITEDEILLEGVTIILIEVISGG